MQAWRIRLLADDGGKIGPGRVVLRCCGAALSAAALGLGYLWCLVDQRGRSWHDHLSRSSLVLLPKPAKAARDIRPAAAGKDSASGASKQEQAD